MAFGTAKLTQASFNALSSNKKGVQALQLAESKAKILRLGGYASAAAQTKTQVSSTGFYDEITLGAVTTSGTVSTRTATVNVYGPGDTTARVSLPVYLSSAESVSGVPSGTICIWHGSAASIPSGWHLCDGSNGTPDLRSRFIYGAGGDTNTKSAGGYSVNELHGHWAVGFTHGQEYEYLSVAQMPSHNHYGEGTTSTNGNHHHGSYGDDSSRPSNFGFYNSSNVYRGANGYANNALWNTTTDGNHNHTYSFWTSAVGGGQAFNNLPPLICLCYIMKL